MRFRHGDGCRKRNLRLGSDPQSSWVKRKGRKAMQKYICNICGYIYDPSLGDPDSGVAAGITFEDLPLNWVCPVCGAGKVDFSPAE